MHDRMTQLTGDIADLYVKRADGVANDAKKLFDVLKKLGIPLSLALLFLGATDTNQVDASKVADHLKTRGSIESNEGGAILRTNH